LLLLLSDFITQHGTTGVGHQLYGLFTSMTLHNLRNYRFDFNMFTSTGGASSISNWYTLLLDGQIAAMRHVFTVMTGGHIKTNDIYMIVI